MARSERTRSPRNGGASAGQRAVRSRPRSALRQGQPAPPDQAEFVLCEQTILAVSRPIMVMLMAGGSSSTGPATRAVAHRCHRGRPPHLSKTRSRLPLEVHEAAFAWVLERLAERGLIKGERIGVDASTMEANAALRAIVRRDTGEGYREMLERLAAESGIATPTAEDLIRLDRQRKGKRLSNGDWTSPVDPEARIARLKDGRTRLAYKPEHAVDLDTGAIVAAEIHPADQGDTTTLPATLETATANLAVVDAAPTPANPTELVADKSYHSRDG